MKNNLSMDPLDHAISIRALDLQWLLSRIAFGESCCLVGISNVGLTFVGRALAAPAVWDVASERIATRSRSLVVFVDCNSLRRIDGELLLLLTADRVLKTKNGQTGARLPASASAETPIERYSATGIAKFNKAIEDVIADGFNLCIVYDPFDECLAQVDTATLLHLRAARDEFKPSLSYMICTTQRPETIRTEDEAYPFTSLFWGRTRYLQPLDGAQARSMFEYLMVNRNISIPESLKTQVIQLSGGHPGLLRTLFEAAVDSLSASKASLALNQDFYYTEGISQECGAIAESLSQEEINSLIHVSSRRSGTTKIRDELIRKGVLVFNSAGQLGLFSPLFEEYLHQHSGDQSGLIVDLEREAVEYGSEDITAQFTATEHSLLMHLIRRRGEVCTKDDIAAALWPDDMLIPPDDNRIQKAVDRLRSKLKDTTGSNEQFIQTIRGRGYRFVAVEEVDNG